MESSKTSYYLSEYNHCDAEPKDRDESPLISVIMPAYNNADTIVQSIESVLRQSVPLELIIINDCSTDALEDVLQAYLSLPQIHLITNPKNLGAAQSRNIGVSYAKGKYVAFLDSDDWWTDDKLEKQLALLEETESVLCSTARELVTKEGTLTRKIIPVPSVITYPMLLRGNVINCSSVLFLTSVAKEFPMEHEDSHEDYILWLKILRKYKKACAINEPLLKYRLTTTGKSGHKLHSATMTWKVYRYMGFGKIRSAYYFLQYMVNGVRKYITK